MIQHTVLHIKQGIHVCLIQGIGVLQQAGQMWGNEVLGGSDYSMNSIQYLNHSHIYSPMQEIKYLF